MKIILASKSPRRKDLLKKIICDFQIIVPNVDETPLPSEKPILYAERISILKALAVANSIVDEKYIIISSDTIVSLNDIILGKPLDYEDAYRMLSMLSGKTHVVHTAVTIFVKNNNTTILTETETTYVTFKKLSEKDIRQYLNTIEWHDKAGSYAIQEKGKMIVDCLDGSLTNVIGFPLRRFFSMIETLGLSQNIYYN